MFVVMGATGNTGRAAAAELQRRGVTVRALTRDPDRVNDWLDGVELIRADPSDADSLAAAFSGAHGVYAMIPPHLQAQDVVGEGLAAARAIAEAVRRSEVAQVVALSSGGAHQSEGTGVVRTLHDLEAELRGCGASVTFIRAADFMENWAFALPVALHDGVVPSARAPLDRKLETVSALDVGATAAACLLEPRAGERIVNLRGPEDYAPDDVAAAFGEVLARPVAAVATSLEACFAAYVEAGIGPDYARGLIELYDGLNSGRVGFEPGVGESRRGATTLLEAVRRMSC